jgi:hypothetical protein
MPMIVDWTDFPLIRTRWALTPALLSNVLYALAGAKSQADVNLSLTPPVYVISPGQPPSQHEVTAMAARMLGYEIEEQPTYAKVKLHAV